MCARYADTQVGLYDVPTSGAAHDDHGEVPAHVLPLRRCRALVATYGKGVYQEQQSPYGPGCLEQTIRAVGDAVEWLVEDGTFGA